MVRRVSAGLAFLVLAVSGPGRGQDASGPYPKFQDGVVTPPAAAVWGVPFDLEKAFPAPPPGENAAPLYLDALYEFGVEVAACFPDGPEKMARLHAVKARSGRAQAAYDAFTKDPSSVPVADLDAVVAEHREGFRKLAEAQKRPVCVFQTGVGFSALLPHAQAARMVVRVAAIKVQREIDRGEIGAAVADVRTVLRLARDLRPRGYLISQLVAGAVTDVAVKQLVEPILAAPGLTAAHCDGLMAALADADAKAVDPYAESIAQEYVGVRVTLQDLILRQAKIARALAVAPGKSVVKAVVKPLEVGAFRKGENPPPLADTLPDDVDEVVANTTPEHLNRTVGEMNAYYNALLALKGRPRLEQSAKQPDPARFFPGNDPLNVIVRQIQMTMTNLPPLFGRHEAGVRCAEALTAVRRWQLTHDGASPADLEAASKAAGLKAAPPDPFDGKPLRLVRDDGRPVVYSIGKDGRDDGGKIDSDQDRRPGDLTFRLAAGK